MAAKSSVSKHLKNRPRVRPVEQSGEIELDRADREELRDALTRELPEIPCKFFYDDRGMALFGQITEMPEYYQTRTEASILLAQADAIIEATQPEIICELGAGEAFKIRYLIDAGRAHGCLQAVTLVDINREAVEQSCAALREAYPDLEVVGVVADFTKDLSFLASDKALLATFLAGTFGNFHPAAATEFLALLAQRLKQQDALLLGVDLVKDAATLEAAYDDSAGITAQFNINALRHLNRVSGSDFDPAAFQHVAFYDSEHERIEMRLRATRPTRVSVPAVGLEMSFNAGDDMRTELSCKYTEASLSRLAAPVDLTLRKWFTDADALFGLAILGGSAA